MKKKDSNSPLHYASSVSTFHDLVKRYYEESFTRFPIWGSQAGRHEFDAEMGHAGPRVWRDQAQLGVQTLARIEDLPPQDFCESDLLDRRTMLANLRLERLELVTWRRWENNPQLHLHAVAEAIHDLFVRNADNLARVAGAIISRLKQIPRYLDEAAEGLRRPDPLWKGLTIKAAPAVGSFFISLAQPLATASGQSVSTLRRVTQRAEEAVAAYAAHVKSLRSAPAGSYAIGEERLAALMRERLGICWSPGEAAAAGRRLAQTLAEQVRQEARRFDARKDPLTIIEEARGQWRPEGKSLLEAYERTMRRIRQRFEEADWIDFPKGDRLLVRLVPEFMRDQFPTAAYSSPGPLDPDQTGIFWVNDLSRYAQDEGQRRAETAQHFGLDLTCAHEAYPGHHLQFIRQNRIPSLARKMAQHAVYYEGWTLWCEQMLADLEGEQQEPENPYTRLLQLRDSLWRAWRIVIDVGLQTGELSYDAACEVLQREVGFTRARAQADVNWYTTLPTVPMSYLIGKTELLRLKRQRVDTGGMSLREFNDWVLSFGAIPWRWIEESGM